MTKEVKDIKIGDRVRHPMHGIGDVKWVDCFGAWVQWAGHGWMSVNVPPCDLHKTGSIGGGPQPNVQRHLARSVSDTNSASGHRRRYPRSDFADARAGFPSASAQ